MNEKKLIFVDMDGTICTAGNTPHFDMYICDKSFNADVYFDGLPIN